MKLVKDTDNKTLEANKVSDKEAEEAFKKILTWLGEDPNREGLLETPKRVMKAYKEYFSGYKVDPSKVLATCIVSLSWVCNLFENTSTTLASLLKPTTLSFGIYAT